MARQSLYIEGLKETIAAFNALPVEVKAKSDLLVKEIAAYVATSTHAAASTRAEVMAAGTIKAAANAVSLGGGRTRAGRMALGTEFGGKARATTQQFRTHRGRQGYFFWPTIRAESAVIRRKWDDLLDAALRKFDG